MRRSLTVGLAVGCSAVATAVFVLSRPSRIEAARPATLGAAVPPLDAPTSVILAPVFVSVDQVVALANAKVPAQLIGGTPLDNFGPTSGNSVGWNLKRTTIAGAASGGRLELSTTISGSVTVKGSIKPIRGSFGHLLGSLNPSQPYSQTLDLSADVTASAAPTVTPAWRITPDFRARASLSQAKANIAHLFDLSLRDKLQPRLDDGLAGELDRLNASVANDPFLEQAARRLWTRLCTPFEIRYAAGQAPLWLEIAPRSLGAGHPSVSGDHVGVTLEARASLRLTSQPPSRGQCPPFPTQLEIVEHSDGRSLIAVAADLDFATLNRAVADQIANIGPLRSPDAEAKIEEVALSPNGDSILVSLKGVLRETRVFGAHASARLYLSARPHLNAATQTLNLADVRLDADSAGLLGRFGTGTFRAIAPLLERRLSDLSWNLERQSGRLKEEADEALGRLSAAGGAVRVDHASVDMIQLTGVAVSGSSLRVAATAGGTLVLGVTQPLP